MVETPPLPTSLDELLASILRGDLPDPLTMASFGPEAIHAAACEHDVVPLIADRLASDARLPAPLRARFLDEAHNAVVRDLAVESELRRIHAAFAVRAVPLLLVKGSHLAYSHYARPDLRARIDSDLLIARAQRDHADEVLTRELGYVANSKLSGELTATQKLYVRSENDAVVHLVDLHWRLASPQVFAHVLSFEEIYTDSVPLPALGPTARGPSDVHALLIACMHRVAHHHDEADRFKWLFDIHLLASRLNGAAWDAFTTLVIARQVAAVCVDSLERSARWFHTVVPSRFRDDPGLSAVAEKERTAGYLRARPLARAVLDDLRALPGWRERANLMREHVLPAPDYMRKVYAPSSRLPLPLLYLVRLGRGVSKWLRAV